MKKERLKRNAEERKAEGKDRERKGNGERREK